MIIIVGELVCPILGEKFGVYIENQCYDQFLGEKIAVFLEN
jgi:hypothetical protein